MKTSSPASAFTLIEMMITTSMIGVVGLLLYSVLYTGTILGAKNTAVNTAHQQARVAMLNMLQDIHSAISLPALADSTGTAYTSLTPANAAGISFQEWSSGPHKIISNASAGQSQITLSLTTGTNNPTPVVGQHLIIPSCQIEADITAVSGPTTNFKVTLGNIYGPSLTPPVTYPVQTLPDLSGGTTGLAISGTGSTAGDVVCFVTDRCSYTVNNGALNWNWKGNSRIMASDVNNATPFSFSTGGTGAVYSRSAAGINFSTSDVNFSNRGYKSADILLNRQVTQKTKLTTYQ